MAYYAEKDFFEDDELIQLVTSILEGNLTLDWYRVDTPRVRARPADPGRGLTYEDCNLGPYGYDVIPEFLRDRYSMASRGGERPGPGARQRVGGAGAQGAPLRRDLPGGLAGDEPAARELRPRHVPRARGRLQGARRSPPRHPLDAGRGPLGRLRRRAHALPPRPSARKGRRARRLPRPERAHRARHRREPRVPGSARRSPSRR